MEESVLLGTKPLVDSIRHFIRDPSGVFSVCHLCECRIVQWRHDSRHLLLLNWFLHIIKRTLRVSSKIWILCSRGIKFISFRHRVISSINPFILPRNLLHSLFQAAKSCIKKITIDLYLCHVVCWIPTSWVHQVRQFMFWKLLSCWLRLVKT